MKGIGNGRAASDPFKSAALIKCSGLLLISVIFFYLGKHFSDSSAQQLVFFSSHQNPAPQTLPYSSAVALCPNLNRTLNVSSLTNDTVSMTDDFEVGEYDSELVENWVKGNESDGKGDNGIRVRVKKFPICPDIMREYIPRLDNEEAIKKLNSTKKWEKFERHCPEKGNELNCLIPAPKGYKTPIPWPRSRDEQCSSFGFSLAEDKGGQNWITIYEDKFKFPGGGTKFIHGADQYLNQIEKMIPEIAFGRHTRVALDVGCGVASFGAYLLSRNVTTLSVAPKDVHENQIQFALEHGVPAMVATFATRRLLYPSQAFDLIHCSRCRINWTRDDGILLLEVNRMLWAGGYFAWAAQPVYKQEAVLEEQWAEMVSLTHRLCWTLVKKEGYIAIWQKHLNNSCYFSREEGIQPPLCEPDDEPDSVWYADLKACIARLPEEGYGSNVTAWPERLQNPPDRLKSIQIDAYISRKELFRAESRYWKEIIDGYLPCFNIGISSNLEIFAAALIENHLDCWVLNIVPVSGPNTLPVIYDRGLIGVMHDWCEPFDTYPRTYDLIHAAGFFSVERKRCNIPNIMLEMDQILRPGGRVYIPDSLAIMDELKEVGTAMVWHVAVRDTSEGPHASYRILTCDKRLLQA
ncbi:hypothetical protein Pfo_015319 [Paulownia fortunei]|nr:hypothetical protein Pfo_015319 [Paulownia fortunei]